MLALFFYVLVGAVIPVVSGRIGAAGGQEYREAFGALNTCVLDKLYGLEETLQYGQQEARIAKMAEQTRTSGDSQRRIEAGRGTYSAWLPMV